MLLEESFFWKNYLNIAILVFLFHVISLRTCPTSHSLVTTQSQALDTQYFYGRSSVLIKGVQGPKFQIRQSPFWLLFVQPIGILTPCFSDFELKAWKSRIASLNTLSVGEVLRISLIILRFQCSVAVSFKAQGPRLLAWAPQEISCEIYDNLMPASISFHIKAA